jgi:hypothetical protein
MNSTLREFVDERFNCEDILMQFTVPAAQHPPLLVGVGNTLTDSAAPFTTEEEDLQTGISKQKGYIEERVRCARTFGESIGWPLKMITHLESKFPQTYGLHGIHKTLE